MENEKSLWNKKQDELTVSDVLKVEGTTLALCIAIPVTCIALVGGATHAWDKFQTHRANRKAKKAL